MILGDRAAAHELRYHRNSDRSEHARSAITRAPAEVKLGGTDEEEKDKVGLATPKVTVAVSPSAAQRYRQALGLNQCSRTRLAHWT